MLKDIDKIKRIRNEDKLNPILVAVIGKLIWIWAGVVAFNVISVY